MSAPKPVVTGAVAALWAQMRVIVLDVETVVADDGLHVIEVATVTCRGGERTSRTWMSRINPGVPVDDGSHRIHGISDADLVDEPPFASVEPELTRRLRGLDGETVVLAGHNVGYDVAVLRREYQRIGMDMPDLLLLDTRLLTRHAAVGVTSGSLADLLTALSLSNPAAHSAGGDAEATADALLHLLAAIAETGRTDFTALHAQAMGARRRVSDIKPTAPKRPRHSDDPEDEPYLPAEHAATHAPGNGPIDGDGWTALLAECARLRCPYTADRVATASLDAKTARGQVEQVLTGLLAADPVDVPAAATIVGALAPLLEQLSTRAAALAWHDRWQPLLASLGRCGSSGRDAIVCPDCRAGRPCPLDTWYQHLAVAARLPVTAQSRTSFLHTQGADVGKGVFTTWLKVGRPLLAEATARIVYDEHRATGHEETAAMFARYAWLAGGRDPRLAAAYATLLATPGDLVALQRAIDTCSEASGSRSGSTDDAWAELGAKRAQLQGRAARLHDRHTGDLDADGNPVPVRRHVSTHRRRTRAPRFQVSADRPEPGTQVTISE